MPLEGVPDTPSPTARTNASGSAPPRRVVVCSTSRPVSLHVNAADGRWEVARCESAATASLQALAEHMNMDEGAGMDVGEPTTASGSGGSGGVAPARFPDHMLWVSSLAGARGLHSSQAAALRETCLRDHATLPVILSHEQYDALYAGYALGDLLHCLYSKALPSLSGQYAAAHERAASFEAFVSATTAFLDALTPLIRAGDVIVVHNYQLCLLPQLLRRRLSAHVLNSVRIVMLFATPWPTSEMFRCLPERNIVLNGCLGADVIVFQEFSHLRHFTNAVTHLLGADVTPRCVILNNNVPSADDSAALTAASSSAAHTAAADASASIVGGKLPTATLMPNAAGSMAGGRHCAALLALPLGVGMRDMRAAMQEMLAERRRILTALKLSAAAEAQRDKRMHVMVAVDKLHSDKGTIAKLLAFDEMLERNKSWYERVTFVVCVRSPSARTTYTGDSGIEVSGGAPLSSAASVVPQFTSAALSLKPDMPAEERALLRSINELVGRVNGRHGTATWIPIRLLRQPLSRRALHALYSVADVGVMASAREGLTVPALEFVAAQGLVHGMVPGVPRAVGDDTHPPGVLCYSEFAGGCTLLQGALIVNPHNTATFADALHAALSMAALERAGRLEKLVHSVTRNDADAFGQVLASHVAMPDTVAGGPALASAAALAAPEVGTPTQLDVAHVLTSYIKARSGRRLVVVSYNGTLRPFTATSDLAAPSHRIFACLAKLAADPRNDVWLMAAQSATKLRAWFDAAAQYLPGLLRVGLAAEHGLRWRPPVPAAATRTFDAMDAAGQRPWFSSFLADAPVDADGSFPMLDATAAAAGGLLSERAGSEPASSSAPAASPALPPQPPSSHVAPLNTALSPHLQLSVAGMPSSGVRGGAASAFGALTALEQQGVSSAAGSSIDLSWRAGLASIMEYFTQRTPGSVLHVGEALLLWSWQDADEEFGATQARDLRLHLDAVLDACPTEVICAAAHRYLLVRPLGVSKGSFLSFLLSDSMLTASQTDSEAGYSFALIMGDEVMDEDMYPHTRTACRVDMFSAHAGFSINIGRRDTCAEWCLPSAESALQLLEAMGNVSDMTATPVGATLEPLPAASTHMPTAPTSGLVRVGA